MDKLKLVKTLVFIITFLLVFGSLLLLGTLYSRTKGSSPSLAANVSLNEPSGSRIASMEVKDDNICILVKDGGLGDRIVIFSLKTGAKTSVINLN